jgi:GDP-6-deoxy-D-talose 4-dehydrogenase
MTRRVLITGSEGFTGRYVAAALRDKHWQIIRTGINAQPAYEDYICADLRSPEDVARLVHDARADAVIHLAAVAFVAHGDPSAFYDINVVATRHLLAALAESRHKPSSIVLASSANIYGNQTAGTLSETTTPNPANDYAVSKLAMEYMSKLWVDRLPITITRPFNYTGVGQNPFFLVPKIVKHCREKHTMIELGNLDVGRDFSDVRDVAAVYATLAERPMAGEILNICSGNCHQLRDVVTMAQSISEHTLQIQVDQRLVRDNEVKVLRGDVTKLAHLMGDQPRHDLSSTLQWMLNDQ